MRQHWWVFELHPGWLMVRTPWFACVLSEWGKWWDAAILWRGIGFWWSPNRDVWEGEFYFNRELILVTETVSVMDLHRENAALGTQARTA
jgi:hypothetical protein